MDSLDRRITHLLFMLLLVYGNDFDWSTVSRSLNLQVLPHPSQPGVEVGPGVSPDFHEVVRVFNSGSLVVCVCVGWGFGVTVIVFGDKVMPPIIVVVPPIVSVSWGNTSV